MIYKCFCCGLDKVTLEEEGWHNHGTVDTLNPGYGSRHDLTQIKIAICDDCLDANSDRIIEKKDQFFVPNLNDYTD